jgi:hypothetical protein
MSSIVQIARFLCVVGLVLLAVSSLFPEGVGLDGSVQPHTYEARCFFVTGDMNLWIQSGDETSLFSLYIVNSTDITHILETGTMEGIEPVFVLENATEYSGVVDFPQPGIYAWFLSTPYNDTLFIQGGMSSSLRMPFFLSGLVMISPMAIIFIDWLFRKRFRFWEFKKNSK